MRLIVNFMLTQIPIITLLSLKKMVSLHQATPSSQPKKPYLSHQNANPALRPHQQKLNISAKPTRLNIQCIFANLSTNCDYLLSLPISIYADNQPAIKLAYNPEYHSKSQHIDVIMHFQRAKIETGLVEVIYIPTDDIVADGFIKLLNKLNFKRFVEMLRLE